METNAGPEVYDLLILVDATSSMTNYLAALKQSLPQVISISALTNCFERIGVLAYRDYCDKNLLEWSGWMHGSDLDEGQPDIVEIASELEAIGGGDYPEATKTGLAKAYQLMREDATTLILLYTDAPPHMEGGRDNGYNHAALERKALMDDQVLGEEGSWFADWVVAAQTLRGSSKRAHVWSILDRSLEMREAYLYRYLSEMTGGATIVLESKRPRAVSEITIELLLSWMGVRKEGAESEAMPAKLLKKVDVENLDDAQSEIDLDLKSLFGRKSDDHVYVSRVSLEQNLPKKETVLPNFTETFKKSQKYRAIVTKQLREIISRDVATISLNPVFGSLWRVFCNDRQNEARQELLDLFGRQVEAIPDTYEKNQMKEWLASSYDFTGEVLEIISDVPESQFFPCVCLDPTLDFSKPIGDDEDEVEEGDQPITFFKREELLELGRSCDWRILRRLGRILTRLTFVKSADAMPAHIAATSDREMQRIPMALASAEHGSKFWKILLHIVVPGTMLSARPSALLAALAIHLGIKPLLTAADLQMLSWRTRWNDIEVPETWNANCLSLLLNADKGYRQRMQRVLALENHPEEGLLLEKDRALFERLIEYKLLERNLDTTLTARVGWKPSGTSMPVGPVVVCKTCEFPRSVTVMGSDGVCGLCLDVSEDAEAAQKARDTRVSKSDNEDSNAVWYECSVQACRAQYIVYNVEALNVRPKCHYCRTQGADSSAPTVQCVKCLSRMVWPLEYRPHGGLTDWECIACRMGKQTIVDTEVTANQLRIENGQEWLLENRDQKLSEPFNNRTLYHTASEAMPLDDLCDRLVILPGRSDAQLQLFLHGKLIRNIPELLDQLYSWIQRRRVQSGTCSLCFSDKRKQDLHLACGRRGCGQLICQGCLEGWYGLNAAGRIINTAALACPFCRRAPTAKTLASYGMGIHAVADLREAVAHHGEWIYAWCLDCGHAKPYLERVCAAGAPPELYDWTCDSCAEAKMGEVMAKVKPCPGCGILTEKVSGCDHIRCHVPDCNVHWCFFCGRQEDEKSIYKHMSQEHGGYFNGAADGVEQEDDDDDDDMAIDLFD